MHHMRQAPTGQTERTGNGNTRVGSDWAQSLLVDTRESTGSCSRIRPGAKERRVQDGLIRAMTPTDRKRQLVLLTACVKTKKQKDLQVINLRGCIVVVVVYVVPGPMCWGASDWR